MDQKIRVLHFVTGGFSGATHMVIDLIKAHQGFENIESLLVLRKKKNTHQHLQILEQANIHYHTIRRFPHLLAIYDLYKICKHFQPDIVVAHGYPEHILGRWAGLLAKVPHLIQVEHNTKERYNFSTYYQTRFLSKYSTVIGVSEGVADVLKHQNLSTPYPILAIPNGINIARFTKNTIEWKHRENNIIMVGRFAKAKDHETIINAIYILGKRNIKMHAYFYGGGQQKDLIKAKSLTQKLGISHLIHFMGIHHNIETILPKYKYFVMSSKREGLCLSAIEGMASGCLLFGSDIPGISELIDNGKDGWLFHQGNAEALANLLENAKNNDAYSQILSSLGQQKSVEKYTVDKMALQYKAVFCKLITSSKIK